MSRQLTVRERSGKSCKRSLLAKSEHNLGSSGEVSFCQILAVTPKIGDVRDLCIQVDAKRGGCNVCQEARSSENAEKLISR
jgi:hypothetical protein